MGPGVAERLTVSRDHFLSHVVGAHDCGLQLDPIYQRCGIEPGVLENPNVRLPYDSLSRLRLEICRMLDDENAGFLERPAPWGSTVLFCHAIVSSRTLREAVERYRRYSDILNDEVHVDFCAGGEEASIAFTFDNLKQLDDRAEIESRIFFFLSFAFWLTDRRFRPAWIGLAFPEPEFAEDYAHVVPCRYRYDQPINRIVFDAQLLREPVRRSPGALKPFLAHHLSYLLTETLAIGGVAERVRRVVEASKGSPQTIETVAEILRIPPTTMRRKLRSEGASFQSIKDDVRRRVAIRYLTQLRLTVAETAQRTGFSDPSAFSRAFKDWTGLSPTDYAASASSRIPESQATRARDGEPLT